MKTADVFTYIYIKIKHYTYEFYEFLRLKHIKFYIFSC